VTTEKDKAEPSALGGNPVLKTEVGVPALPIDRPSDQEMTRELPASTDEEDPPTAIDMKALSKGEAERVLSGKPAPAAGVAGALPAKPGLGAPIKTPPLGPEMFPGLNRGAVPIRESERPTRAGVAAQAAMSPKGRSTLLLDGSAPPAAPGDPNLEGPPIVVPASTAMPPKAVTQPPPWGAGAAHVGIPAGPGAPRAREPSIEEISSSMLLPAEASSEMQAVHVEELSGSVLIEDAPDGRGPPVVTQMPMPSATPRPPSVKPPVPGSVAPGRPVSVKPPVPTSPSNRPAAHAHRTLLGMSMPELPKTTPAPRLDYMPGAAHGPPAEPVPIPIPAPIDPFAGAPLPPGGELFSNVPAAPAAPPPAAAPPLGAPLGAPPPTAPMTGDVELTRLPGSPLEKALDTGRRLVRRIVEVAGRLGERVVAVLPENTLLRSQARPPWFLPAVALAGLVVGIGLVGLLVSAVRAATRSSERETPAPSASARPPSTTTATTPKAVPSVTAPAPQPTGPVLPACTLAGAPHVIGPSATVAAGVEVGLAGGDLALGFAPTDHDAMIVRVNATTLSASTTVKAHSRDSIRRVTPLLAKGSLTAAVDVDHKGDRLQGRRTVRSSPPAQLGGTSDGHLSWARPGGAPAGQLWPLGEGSASVDALRGATDLTGDPTVAIAFRRGGAVWMGTLAGTGGLAPSGDLAKVEGLGTAIGSPAVAISSNVVMVMWADRASSDQPWSLRWTRFDSGGAPGEARTFTPPPGGKGQPIMSPALTAVPGGRFLLVWTEGPASGHAVRALTLGPDGTPIGDPLDLSADGMNAGQAQAAVGADGAGVVAFLESSSGGFEVAASPITCGKS